MATQRVRFAAHQHPRAQREGVGDVFFHLVHGSAIDQRAEVDAVLHAVADHLGFDRLLEPLGKLVVDAGLHEDAVGADAGLAGVAEFRGHHAGHGCIQIGIVEDDEGRVAAEFHRYLFHRTGALRHQLLADLGGAGESELAHHGAGGEDMADHARLSRHDVEHARRNARLGGEYCERERRIRRGAGGLHHDRAARSQRRTGLARDHRVRKIPRRDRRDHADWLLQHDDAPVVRGRRNDVAVNALGFFREPFDEGRAVGDFAARLGQRLALLVREDACQILLVLHAEVEPAAQQLGTILGAALTPGWQRALGSVDCALHVIGREARHTANHLTIGRVRHGDRSVVGGVAPLPVDVALFAKERCVLEFHG